MTFALIIIGSIVALGIIAALFSWGDNDDPVIKKEGDCSSCSSRSECKLVELKEEGQRRKDEKGHCGQSALLLLLGAFLLFFASCATKKNTAS